MLGHTTTTTTQTPSLVKRMNEEIEIAEGFRVRPVNESYCLGLNVTKWIELNITEQCYAAVTDQGLPASLMVVIQVFYALVCVVGLCGNTLVIYVVLRFSKMQTVTMTTKESPSVGPVTSTPNTSPETARLEGLYNNN